MLNFVVLQMSSFLFLFFSIVKPVKAVELLTSVQSYLKRWKEDTGYNSKQEVRKL